MQKWFLKRWARALRFFFTPSSCISVTPCYFTYWTLTCLFWIVRWILRVHPGKYSVMLWVDIFIFILNTFIFRLSFIFYNSLRLSKSTHFPSEHSSSPTAIIYSLLYFPPWEPNSSFIYSIRLPPPGQCSQQTV